MHKNIHSIVTNSQISNLAFSQSPNDNEFVSTHGHENNKFIYKIFK